MILKYNFGSFALRECIISLAINSVKGIEIELGTESRDVFDYFLTVLEFPQHYWLGEFICPELLTSFGAPNGLERGARSR